ncbi:MAG: hypothetical protein FWD58_00630 [Firmicutes bacterium]|nr:hypothetical protein [Bacillota bacterium]
MNEQKKQTRLQTDNCKLTTFLGFAIKSGKIIFGTDNILFLRACKYLILYDASLADNAQKKLERYAQECSIPMLLSAKPLCELVHRGGVKAVAITDVNIASAIVKSKNT